MYWLKEQHKTIQLLWAYIHVLVLQIMFVDLELLLYQKIVGYSKHHWKRLCLLSNALKCWIIAKPIKDASVQGSSHQLNIWSAVTDSREYLEKCRGEWNSSLSGVFRLHCSHAKQHMLWFDFIFGSIFFKPVYFFQTSLFFSNLLSFFKQYIFQTSLFFIISVWGQ